MEYLPGVSGYQNGNPATGYFGAAQEHVTGSSEPNGFTRRVEYDNLFRTTKDVSVTNQAITTAWDPLKDLELSTTDPTGLMTTTIYDDDDRAVSQYGPAPSSWFNTDRTPQSAYASQVPRTDTGYDQNITGPAVAWYNYTNANGGALVGAPKLHTTGFDNTGAVHLGRDFRVAGSVPITPDTGMDGYGFSATGKIRFPGTGTYTFKLWTDDGARLFIDDQQVLSNWGTTTEGITQNMISGTFSATAGKPYRFRFDYGHNGNPGGLELWTNGPGVNDDSGQGLGTSHPSFLVPDKNQQTNTTNNNSTKGRA